MAQTASATQLNTQAVVTDVLATIEREREREIIARRFGLFDRKETLEQIGEMLGITRERVRQLEKSVIARLRTTAEHGNVPHIADFQASVLEILKGNGDVARVSDLAAKLTADANREEQARVAFLSQLGPELAVLNEDDTYYLSVSVKSVFDEKALKTRVAEIIAAIKKIGEPESIEKIAKAAGFSDVKQAAALASTSKQLATLNGRWGLVKWPMVNPKNIRDKIYVIL
ncbi:MAG TPA: sigma factor-like helix-turn-helix DNA-binding protein, partial [Candidatus Saccharimonadales bacterium]